MILGRGKERWGVGRGRKGLEGKVVMMLEGERKGWRER